MESVYLKTFIEVVNTGNLTRAADNLNVTPSAVSRRIKFIEEQYDYSLLDRSGSVLIPTDAGKLVYEKALQLIQIERELLRGLADARKSPKISFCCTPAFGIAYLPEVLRNFMFANKDMENLEFIFDMPENLVRGLRDNLYDIAVIEHCSCLDLNDFTSIVLPEDEMIFVSAPQLIRQTPYVSLDSLTPQVLYTRRDGCCSRKFLEFNMDRIGRSVAEFDKMIVYDDLHVIIDSVIKGEGVAFLSKSLVDDHMANGRLTGHHVDGFMHYKNRTLVVSKTIKPEAVYVDFVKEIFSVFNLPFDRSAFSAYRHP